MIYLDYPSHESIPLDRIQPPRLDEEYATLTNTSRFCYCRHGEYSWTLARVSRGSKVLDVGCGDTQVGAYLAAKKCCNVTVIDTTDLAARQKFHADNWKTQVEFRRTDGIDLPPQSFDAAMCISSLEHNGDVKAANEIIVRAVKTGGRVIYTVPFDYRGHAYRGQHFLSFDEIWSWLAQPCGGRVEMDFITHKPDMASYEFCNASRAAVALVNVEVRR